MDKREKIEKVVPRKIVKKKEQESMRKVVDNMTQKANRDTALSYTRTWVESVSRGGLCLVNDTTFFVFSTYRRFG